MAIENSVSNDFLSMFVDSINVFDCCLSGVMTVLIVMREEVNIISDIRITQVFALDQAAKLLKHTHISCFCAPV